MSIHWPIIRRLVSGPLRPRVVDDSRTYRGVDILVAALHVAAEIRRSSSSPTIGVMLPTSGAFPIAAMAGWMAGRTVVPLNYLLKREELQYVVNDCGTDAIVTLGPMLDFLGPAGAPSGVRMIRLEQMDFRTAPEFDWPALARDDDLAALLYTSGTSGRPKGVMLTHGNISANIRQIAQWIRIRPSEVFLGVLPQFHSFGHTALTLLPLTLGCRVVYTARFVPAKIIRLMRQHRPTVFIAIPSMFNALLHAKDAGKDDFASVRYLVSGGEPLPRAVLDAFRERFGATICEGYGLTETSPVTNWCRPWEWRPGSVGKPLPDVEERIVDIATGVTLPPGLDGEVRIRGPNVMRGYYRLPADTAACFDEEGFFRTGDIGRFDADGSLFITGRLKEMLIVGGENVFPREIEEVLNAHASVKDSGVIGVQDPMRGELPLAFVELKDGSEFDEKALLGWCRQKLAGYKVPTEIRHLPALPRNPTGKVMRRELKSLAKATA